MPRKQSNAYWKSKITALRKKYAPRKSFDLVSHAEWIVSSASTIEDFSNQLRDKSKDHDTLERIINSAHKTLNLLNELSGAFKYDMDLFIKNGCKEPLNALANISSIKEEESILTSYQVITSTILTAGNLFMERKQRHKNKPGKNYRIAITEHYVFYLIRVFHQMTGVFPECRHNRVYEKGDTEDAEYEGRCYDFLLEMRQILLDSFDVNLGTDSFIGKCANSLIKQYRKKATHTK